jgi:hypothetical protein
MDKLGNVEFHGDVKATKMLVEARWWSDFVFSPNYRLRTIEEVDTFIKTNQHLPDMPS